MLSKIDYITTTPNVFINQTLKCIFVLIFYSNEANEKNKIKKKSKFYTCMINKHTKFQNQLKEKCWMSLFKNNSKGFNDMIGK